MICVVLQRQVPKYPVALIVSDWEALKSSLRAAGEPVATTHAELSQQTAAIKNGPARCDNDYCPPGRR